MAKPFTLRHWRAWCPDLILDTGQSFRPQGFQDDFIKDLFAGWPECWLVVPEGNGKALDVSTPIPTPTGWTTMGLLAVGDEVLGADGRPTRVRFATDVMYDRECYRVTFSDGASIVADADHLWAVEGAHDKYRPRVLTTRDLLKAGVRMGSEAHRWRVKTDHRRITGIDRVPSRPVRCIQVDAADSIAYDTHDADDALEVGLLNLDELLETPLWREAATRVHKRYTALSPKELRLAAIRELIDWLVSDVLDVSRETLAEHEIDSVAEVRSHGGLVRFSREVHEAKSHFEAHMYERVYRHPKVVQMRERAKAMLREMFELLVERSQRVPELAESEASTEAPFARVVGDYLAAMTDRTAYQRYQLLVSGAGA